MKSKTRVRVIAITVLGVLGTVFVTALARRDTPKPATITDLNSTELLTRKLHQDADKVTLIALVSPVCPLCRHGFTDVQSVLKNVSDDRLRVHIVFLPMYPGDNKSRAQTRAEEFNDARVSYYWHGDKLTGKEWQKVLDIESIAWDVYLLYGPNSYQDGSAAKPTFWMHQLEGVTKAPCLKKAEFESKIKDLLATSK